MEMPDGWDTILIFVHNDLPFSEIKEIARVLNDPEMFKLLLPIGPASATVVDVAEL